MSKSVADAFAGVLVVLEVFIVFGFLLGGISIPSVLILETLLFGLGLVVGVHERALHRSLQSVE